MKFLPQLSPPFRPREVEVSEKHGLNEVGLFDDLNVVPLVEGLDLFPQVAHDVRLLCHLLQPGMK